MVAQNEPAGWKEPESLAELRLPPTFVYDHCIRTLSYQGALSAAEIARHWHVAHEIAYEVIDSLKAAGIVEIDSGQSTFDRAARVRLTTQGQARVASARSRTWYAGAVPVPVDALGERVRGAGALVRRERVSEALAPFALDEAAVAEIGQALAAGAAINLSGLAAEEQGAIAAALGEALDGEVSLPYSLFMAGSVMRLFDMRTHAAVEERHESGELDILRSRETASQWVRTRRPCVVLAGGVLEADVLPAFDEDARFYLAPTPLKASGGVLAAAACDGSPALEHLTRLWLVPGRSGTGIVLLRSGERIEVPWHAAALLMSEAPMSAGRDAPDGVLYYIDVARLASDVLQRWLRERLAPLRAEGDLLALLSARMEERGLATREAAWRVFGYLSDRAAYEGDRFAITGDIVDQAVGFAERHGRPHPLRRAA
jgi:DNA-binding MarR family transcriptional regulator